MTKMKAGKQIAFAPFQYPPWELVQGTLAESANIGKSEHKKSQTN